MSFKVISFNIGLVLVTIVGLISISTLTYVEKNRKYREIAAMHIVRNLLSNGSLSIVDWWEGPVNEKYAKHNIISHEKMLRLLQLDYDSAKEMLGISNLEFRIVLVRADRDIVYFDYGRKERSVSAVNLVVPCVYLDYPCILIVWVWG